MDGDRTITSTQPASDGRFDGSLPHAGPARVGAELRMVREQLGWTLPALSARLKIRLPFLEAIEAGDLAALPAPAYAAGFIRTYADAMGLDPDEILRRFRAEGMTRAPKPELTFPDPVPDRAVPPMAVALIVAVIAIGAYALWYHHSEEQIRAANSVPPVPAKLAPLASGSQSASAAAKAKPAAKATKNSKAGGTTAPAVATLAPATPAGAPSSAKGSAAETSSAEAAGTPTIVAGNGNGSAATTAPTASAPTASPGAGSSGTASAAGAPTAATPAAAPSAASTASATGNATSASSTGSAGSASTAASGGPALQVSAIAKSWVQIHGPHGKVVFSGILDPGQTWTVPDEPGLVMTTGNAGGTVLVRNGKAGSPLGAQGSVLHGVQLTGKGNTTAGGAAAGKSP